MDQISHRTTVLASPFRRSRHRRWRMTRIDKAIGLGLLAAGALAAGPGTGGGGAREGGRAGGGEPIRVGSFLSVTGPAAFLGDPEQKTLDLYVEKLNAGGGVLGRRLELVRHDSAADAEKAPTL